MQHQKGMICLFDLKKKQIAIIMSAKFPSTTGDTANYMEIINQLIAEGLEVLLLCPKNIGSNDKMLTGVIHGLDIKRIPFQPPRLDDFKQGRRLKVLLFLLPFLVIESFTVIWYLKRKKIRHVYMRHGLLTMQLPLLLKLTRTNTMADGELVTDLLKELEISPTFSRLLRYLEIKILKLYSFFKVSTKQQGKILEELGVPKNKILLIPLSINISKIPRNSIEEIPEHTFGYFGALEPWQSPDMLLEAFKLLVERIPTASLYIIGEGSMKESLKKMVADFKLTSHVVFINGMAREILWNNYFNKFRIAVIPRPRLNNSADTVPSIKLVEALAAGKPIITTDIPAMRDIPEDSAIRVPAGDYKLLARAMESLSLNDKMLKDYSASARESAMIYDIRMNIKKLISNLLTG